MLSATGQQASAGNLELLGGAGQDGTAPELLFCDNETNLPRLYGAAPVTGYPKDGINDHVVAGAATVSPDLRGTKCALAYRLTVAPGASAQLRLRLRPAGTGPAAADALGSDFAAVLAQRQAEADEFYAGLTRSRPAGGGRPPVLCME